MAASNRKVPEADLLEFSSPILQKYSKELSEAASKCSRLEKKGHQQLYYENRKWNNAKITQLAVILSKEDFFRYIIEVGYIDQSCLKCLKCEGSLTLQYLSR
jgi:competence CoiA-like predicted nuclease